jgi:putative phosphoesterase
MRIGLISDTRLNNSNEMPDQIIKAFQGVDLILHAGGIQTADVLDWLERIAPVKAVGRLEGGQAEQPQPFLNELADDPRVSTVDIMDLEGHRVGMVNELFLPRVRDEIMPNVIEGEGLPKGLVSQMVEEQFESQVDIVVFGRTLYALIEEHEGILFVNPGSPTLPKNLNRLGNVAVMELTPGRREAHIIDLRELN